MKKNYLVYSSNLFKKALGVSVSELKQKISGYLENNDLKETKAILSDMERIIAFNKEIDKILDLYNKYFPQEDVSLTIPNPVSSKKTSTFNHYSFEILDTIENYDEIGIYDIKSIVFKRISNHISTEELSINNECMNLYNWEINFYKSIIALLHFNFIAIDEDEMVILTPAGKEYLEVDEHTRDTKYTFNPELEFKASFNKDISKVVSDNNSNNLNIDIDLGYISSIREYLYENIFSNPDFSPSEDWETYLNSLCVIKNIYSLDGETITAWSQIKEKQFYNLKLYFSDTTPTVFVKNKIEEIKVLNAINEDNATTYFVYL